MFTVVLNLYSRQLMTIHKQGPTLHKPMAHPVVSRYLDYYCSMVVDYGRHVCSCLFIELIPHRPKGWRQDHDPTNIRAMVEIYYYYKKFKLA